MNSLPISVLDDQAIAQKHFVEYLENKRGYTIEKIAEHIKISERVLKQIKNGTPKKPNKRIYAKLIDLFCRELLKEGEQQEVGYYTGYEGHEIGNYTDKHGV